jgi:hypothetical protein
MPKRAASRARGIQACRLAEGCTHPDFSVGHLRPIRCAGPWSGERRPTCDCAVGPEFGTELGTDLSAPRISEGGSGAETPLP